MAVTEGIASTQTIRPLDGGGRGSTATIGPLTPGTAAAIVRQDLSAAPQPGDVQRAMNRIADDSWTPAQRDALLTDLARDGTLSGLVNAMNQPPGLYQQGWISADAQRTFFASVAGGSGADGLVATQQAISRSAGTPGGSLTSTDYFSQAVAGHASDVVKADFVQRIAASDLPAMSDVAGNAHMDVASRVAATVLPSIRSDALFGEAVGGLVTARDGHPAGDLPAVLRNSAGLQETLHGFHSAPGARSGIDALMSRVAGLNDPGLSAQVLEAATTGQPADQHHLADALAPAASQLLTDTPAAGGMTGAQRVTAELYQTAGGDDTLGRLMAGFSAGDHDADALAIGRAIFANADDVAGNYRNARLAGYFMESTDRGVEAYNNAVDEDRNFLLDWFSAPLPIPGGPAGALAAEGIKSALSDGWKAADAAAADRFVAGVNELAGIDTSGARDLDAPTNTPAGQFIYGAGRVAVEDYAAEP